MPSVMPDATAAPANPWREALGLGASGPAEAGGASFQAILTGETELAEPAGRPSPAEKPAGEAIQAVMPTVVQPLPQAAVQVPATLLGLSHDGKGLEVESAGNHAGGDSSIGDALADEQGKQGETAGHTSEAVQAVPMQAQVVLATLPTTESIPSTGAVTDIEVSAPVSVPQKTSTVHSDVKTVPPLPSALLNSGQGIAASDWIGEAISPLVTAPASQRALLSDQLEPDTEAGLAIRPETLARDGLAQVIAPPAVELSNLRTAVPSSTHTAQGVNIASEAVTLVSGRTLSASPGVDSSITDLAANGPPARSDTQMPGFPLTFAHSLTHASPGSSFAAPVSNDVAAVPLSGVAVAIASRAANGDSRFEIRLDPPELGRIDVRLDLGRDGSVSSRLVVERAETLDLLRRDAGNLERALQSAGLNTSGSGLEFSLRDGSAQQRASLENFTKTDLLIVPDDDVAVTEAVRRAYGVLRGLGRGIDMRV